MEAALGMSFVGKRALVCMKHVGMNVAADCFINSAVTGVKGGIIVVAADDPSMHSSQNEQDTPLLRVIFAFDSDVRTKQPARSLRHGLQRICLFRTKPANRC